MTGSADMARQRRSVLSRIWATRLADGGPELSFSSRCRPIRWHPMEALSYIIWTSILQGPSSWQGYPTPVHPSNLFQPLELETVFARLTRLVTANRGACDGHRI